MKHFLLFTVLAVFSLISTHSFAQNLVPNGDMESGVDDWTAKFRKGAEGTIATTSDATNGSQAMLIDVTSGSTDASPDLSHGQAESVIYSPEEWTDRATYKLSANLKSNTTENELKWKILPLDADGNKQHIAGLKNDDESFLHLTTEYKNYRWLVNNVKSGYDQGFYFQLQVGLNVAQYFVDDLTLEKVIGIENGGFEDDEDLFAMSTNVTTETGAAADFSIDTDNANTGSKALKVDVTASNDTVGAVNLVTDTRFYPEMGKKYEFTFYAKGTGANDSISLDINYYDGENNFLTMDSKMVKLTDEYQKYSTVFEAETADQNSVRFRIGFGKQVSTIYVVDMTYGDAVEVPNDMPVAMDDMFTTDQDLALTENVATNDTLSNDGGNVFALLDDVTNGTLVLENNGSFTYTPASGFFGDDSFSYTLCDGDGDCDTAMVSIVVNEVVPDDMPVALTDSFEVDKNQVLTGSVADNDTLSDNGGNVFAVTVDPTNGTVSMNAADGSFTYTPTTDFVGEDSFTYSLCDVDDDCSTATVYISVNTPVGVSDLLENTFRCYPSPATTILNVEGVKPGADVEVISITGVVVKRIQVVANPTTINMNDMVQGTYILRSGENITRFIKK